MAVAHSPLFSQPDPRREKRERLKRILWKLFFLALAILIIVAGTWLWRVFNRQDVHQLHSAVTRSAIVTAGRVFIFVAVRARGIGPRTYPV